MKRDLSDNNSVSRQLVHVMGRHAGNADIDSFKSQAEGKGIRDPECNLVTI